MEPDWGVVAAQLMRPLKMREPRITRMITEMSEARSTNKLQTLTRRLEKVDLLVLDDWGLHPLTSEARRDLLEIIQIREMKKSTIVASQLPVKEWHHAIGEGTIADAILDRLLNYLYMIELLGDSMRRKRKLPILDSNQSISLEPTEMNASGGEI